MKCKRCKFFKLNEDKITFQCLNKIPEMNIQCLLRHLYWLLETNRQLGKKVEGLIDKTMDDLNEGEKWKKLQ